VNDTVKTQILVIVLCLLASLAFAQPKAPPEDQMYPEEQMYEESLQQPYQTSFYDYWHLGQETGDKIGPIVQFGFWLALFVIVCIFLLLGFKKTNPDVSGYIIEISKIHLVFLAILLSPILIYFSIYLLKIYPNSELFKPVILFIIIYVFSMPTLICLWVLYLLWLIYKS